MSVNEMEPWAVKTILLMYSKSDDSTEQLRLMLEESIRQKYMNRKLLRPIPGPGYTKKPFGSTLHHSSVDIDESNIKKSKGELKKALRPPDMVYTLNSSSDISTDDSDDIGMEILEDDLACIVCREMASGPRNRLIECSECHCLYHQECHVPNITDMDVNDPRVVWYCVNCSKSVAKPKSAVNPGVPASSNKSTYKTSSTTPRASQPSPVLSFGSKPFGGLSGSSKKQTASSNKSAPNTGKPSAPNNIISADRRLQIMKKRAAKKQEKRILPK